MGVAPYKTFTFDGVSSANYDVYLTGVGVYNAPQRSVEMLSIAGRNGDYALDQGKFENITVTYRVGMYDTDENNFATKVSNFRNWLCSKVGYVRLEDEYNPNEYRMAVYSEGFNLDHDMLIAGEAEITFNCKPQRWLTSGETAVTVADGGTLSNPTPFEAEPLLAIKGYGTIGFNGYEVEIENVPIGDIVLYGGGSSSSITLDESNLNVGDSVTINVNHIRTSIKTVLDNSSVYTMSLYDYSSVTDSNSDFSTLYSSYDSAGRAASFYFDTSVQSFDIVIGTNSSITNTISGTLHAKAKGSPPSNYNVTFSVTQTLTYNASTHSLSFSHTQTASASQLWCTASIGIYNPKYEEFIGHSTKSAITDTVYIDCDIGECWTIQGGAIVSLNGVISLGSDLPKLSSGTNTFALDNTVTELNVTPRWWKV